MTPVIISVLFVLVIDITYAAVGYTDWTTLFWLKKGEAGHPYDHWTSPGSFDSSTNKTASELRAESTVGYRNTFIDSWTAQNAPDRVRVSYLNADGEYMARININTTGTSTTDWMDRDAQFRLNKSIQGYNSSFAFVDVTGTSPRYRMVSLSDVTAQFLVAAGTTPLPLPTLAATAITGKCYASNVDASLNVLTETVNVTDLTHELCAVICLDLKYPFAAVHAVVFCSCLSASPAGPEVTTCSTPCQGDTSLMCGGTDPGYVPINVKETGVNLAVIDGAQINTDSISVIGETQTTYPDLFYLYGYNVTAADMDLPMSFTIEVTFKSEACSGTSLNNFTVSHVVQLTTASPVYQLRFEPKPVQCVKLTMRHSTDNSLLTAPVNLTTVTVPSDSFISATYLIVEASWIYVNTTGMCECECWVHDLLYGDSPFDNLTYEQIEKQLENITSAIIRELSVNKSTLSSTIRTKTSADDDRPSAAVMGYSLGVAILTVSLVGLVLADLPKLLGNLHLIIDNVKSRFSPAAQTECPER